MDIFISGIYILRRGLAGPGERFRPYDTSKFDSMLVLILHFAFLSWPCMPIDCLALHFRPLGPKLRTTLREYRM